MTAYETQVSGLSPVIWFKFDETSGDAVSSGSKTPTLTAYDGPTVNVTSTVSNKCVSYDGTNDYHYYLTGSTSSNQLSGMSDGVFTIEFWTKANTISTTNNQVVWNYWDTNDTNRHLGLYLRGTNYSNTGKITYFTLRSGGSYQETVSSVRIDDNKWHHIVIAQNGNTTKLYIDGVLDTTKTDWTWTTFGWDANSGVKALFGAGVSNYSTNARTEYFVGSIDEFAIYGSELTSTNILDNYYASGIADRYSASAMTVTTSTLPMPTVTATTVINNTYNSGALTADATSPNATWSAETVINNTYTSGVLGTADSTLVNPTISAGVTLDAFGVSTATSDFINPVVSVISNINYSHAVSTASATSPNASVSTTKTVEYSASPMTTSALFGGNVFAGPTVVDNQYHVSIRQVGETTNTDGKNGFAIGSQYTDSTIDARYSVAMKANSGIPTNGALIKVKINHTNGHVSVYTGGDNKSTNEYNVYVFTANPSTTFDTMNYTNLPAKELITTTRAVDADQRYLDLTQAFRDSRAASYGIFIEHVGETPYSGTVYDRTEYNGTNLEDKVLYILTSEYVNINYNAAPATATATNTDVSIYVERYINISASPATASADSVSPNIGTENAVTVSAMTTTASSQMIMPAFASTVSYTPDHLEAHSEMLGFTVSAQKQVNIAADVTTVSALIEMPEAQIGEDNIVSHMDASALLVMPLVVIPDTNSADLMTASAIMKDPEITGQLLGRIYPAPFKADARLNTPSNFDPLTGDIWYNILYSLDQQTPTTANIGILKFFKDQSSLSVGSTTVGQGFAEDGLTDRTMTALSSINRSTSPTPAGTVGFFDTWERKALNIKNIAFNYYNLANISATEASATENGFTLETMIKTEKSNQVLFTGSQWSANTYNKRHTFIMLIDGKLGIKTVTNQSTIVSDSELINASPEILGTKTNVADGSYHHIVVQYGYDGRTQIWIDGKLEIQRYGYRYAFPNQLGYNSDSALFYSDFNISGYSMNTQQFLFESDITKNYFAAIKFTPIYAAPMTASLTMTSQNRAESNRGRALMLYWWPTTFEGKYAGALAGDAKYYGVQATSNDQAIAGEFDEDTFDKLSTWDAVGNPPQNYFGWDVFPVDIQGYFVSDIVDIDAYGASNIYQSDLKQFESGLPGALQYKLNSRGFFRDPITDNKRYLDLINDIDLSNFDAIFFRNYPDQGRELDSYAKNEVVDPYFNIRESVIFQDFLTSLRSAVDTGVSLYVTNHQLAIDLGIIDRVEIVSDLDDRAIYTSDPHSPTLMSTQYSLDNKAKWYDTFKNNKLRVVNTEPGLTDIPCFIWKDMAYYLHDDMNQFGEPDRPYFAYEFKQNGLEVGDEFILSDFFWEYSYNYMAVPFNNVKAGKIITAFANTIWNGNTQIDNPYKNYATSIIVRPGDVLNGKQVGGKIYVNFTERFINQMSVMSVGSRHHYFSRDLGNIDLASDYWIDYAYNNGLITAAKQAELKASEYNIDRLYENGDITLSEYNKRKYWSSNGDLILAQSNVTISLDQTYDVSQQQAGRQTLVQKTNKSGDVSTSKVTSFQQWFTFKYSKLLPEITISVPSMLTRGFWWTSVKTEIEGNVMRPLAHTANASMVMPTIISDKQNSVSAQSMIAQARIVEGTSYTPKDTVIITFPMTATATIGAFVRNINASTMTASAILRTNIAAITSSVDEVILYINHVDPILYLREEIIK